MRVLKNLISLAIKGETILEFDRILDWGQIIIANGFLNIHELSDIKLTCSENMSSSSVSSNPLEGKTISFDRKVRFEL